MASPDLRRLWALHEVDSEILDLKRRAARLDAGFAESAALKALEAKDADLGETARALIAEQLDTELKQRGYDEKIKKFEKQLFGGTVTNAREVDGLQKEIAMLKRQRDGFDDRLLELMDAVPPAQARLHKLTAEIEAAKSALGAKRQAALVEKGKIEAEFKSAVAKREIAKNSVPPALLNRYETIVKRYEGVGMAEVVKGRSCGGCGTLLPARTLQGALEGSVITCESCHRILYYVDGAG
ncbi:MAG: zinc ribbon domain-containing protein [Fimbriimonadaceae bacterium]